MLIAPRFHFMAAFVLVTCSAVLSLPAHAQEGAPDELAPDDPGFAAEEDEGAAAATIDPEAGASDDQPSGDPSSEEASVDTVEDTSPADSNTEAPADTAPKGDKQGDKRDRRAEAASPDDLPEPELGGAAIAGAFGAGFAATGLYGALSSVIGLISTIIGFAAPGAAILAAPWPFVTIVLSGVSCAHAAAGCLALPAAVGGGVTAAGNQLSDYEGNYLYTILASYAGCFGLGFVNGLLGLAISFVATAFFPPTVPNGQLIAVANPITNVIALVAGVVTGGVLLGLGVPAIATATWYASASPKSEFLDDEYEDGYEYEDEAEYEYEDEAEYEYEDDGYDDDGYEDDRYDDEQHRRRSLKPQVNVAVPVQAY